MANSPRDEHTRVDMGDDLVEKTAVVDYGQGASAGPAFESEDQFESARILMSEGLLEEAKKVLRKIMIRDPGHIPSRQKLDEIHEIELKQMFGDGGSGRRNFGTTLRDGERADGVQASAEEVILKLEQDLQLGSAAPFELGGSLDEQFGEFGDQVDHELSGATSRDRIDAGIAFLEMGLYGLACRQFQAASADLENRAAALSLYAYSMILAGRHFEALMTLESALADPDLGEASRVEFVYLVGRAQEGLKRPDLALICYQTVSGWEPAYRDTEDRIHGIRRVRNLNK